MKCTEAADKKRGEISCNVRRCYLRHFGLSVCSAPPPPPTWSARFAWRTCADAPLMLLNRCLLAVKKKKELIGGGWLAVSTYLPKQFVKQPRWLPQYMLPGPAALAGWVGAMPLQLMPAGWLGGHGMQRRA
jgi:hypothetical protein